MTNISLEPEGALAELAAKLTGAQKRDLTSNWDHFCDADHGDIRSDDPNYPDALIAAGYVYVDAVDDDDLETAFAWELGIEAGGSVCRLTPLGSRLRAFLTPPQPEGE